MSDILRRHVSCLFVHIRSLCQLWCLSCPPDTPDAPAIMWGIGGIGGQILCPSCEIFVQPARGLVGSVDLMRVDTDANLFIIVQIVEAIKPRAYLHNRSTVMTSQPIDTNLHSLLRGSDLLKRFKIAEEGKQATGLDPIQAARQKFIQSQYKQLAMLEADRKGISENSLNPNKRNTRCWRTRVSGSGFDVTLRYGIRLVTPGALIAETLDDVEIIIKGFIEIARSGRLDEILQAMHGKYSEARKGSKDA